MYQAEMIQILEPTQKRRQRASQVFRECPQCDNARLIYIDEEALCSECDWNSVELSVECGIFDDLLNQDLDVLERNALAETTKINNEEVIRVQPDAA